MVRCASCSASWRAKLEAPLELQSTPEAGNVGVIARIVDEDLFERPAAELPADELPKVFRARIEGERRIRQAAVQGVVWAVLGAAAALVLILLVVFRVGVVNAWPKAASAYAAIGLPVNRFGLQIEQVHAQPSLTDGRPSLVVSGVLRNIRAEPMTAPRLSITLLDKDGKTAAVKLASPGSQVVAPGQSRSFSVTLIDPPSRATDLDVTFADEPPPPKPARPKPAKTKPQKVVRAIKPKPVAPPPAEPVTLRRTPAGDPAALPPAAIPHEPPPQVMVLTGPVKEAKALPSSDPYALPPRKP